jgi:hypothetical protein
VSFAADLVVPTNSSYFYRLPGPDGVCNTADDVIHMVKTGMGPGAAPIVVDSMPVASVRTAQGGLAGFVAKSGADLVLTDAGKRFANMETDARKKLFAEHLINYVPVMGLIRRVLDERPSHTAPAARFRNELEDYMSEEQADETLKTIVSWARYGELFAYDEQSETFSLENPH